VAQGEDRAAVAAEFLHCGESYRLAVDGSYAAYLHRAGDAGPDGWVSNLSAGGMSLTEVAAALLGSTEFYDNGRATLGS
jgi:hypothetical protein